MSGSHFTLTRLIDHIDGREIPHLSEMLPWFWPSQEPWLLVYSYRDWLGFLHPSPLDCSSPLWYHATAMWGCIMSADLLTQSLHYCVQREHSLFTLLPYAWVGLQGPCDGGRREEQRREEGSWYRLMAEDEALNKGRASRWILEK